MLQRQKPTWRTIGSIAAVILFCASFAHASATLLLEEPYGKLGFFTATGHAAVYLSGVCADDPLTLRPCAPGETGVVVSRYNGVSGYDWVAIPLLPYLYAVDRADDIPLFADAKMVFQLRDRYRRAYLESVVPDGKNGEAPGGNWYELVGSSYDRTIYGFEIETTPEEDARLIRKLNSSRNESHFRTVSNNCADFAKDVINFYYPKSLHRSVVADVAITTPKQMAKMLVKFNRRHPDIQFSRLVIAQVPGSMPRSFAVHGVVESFFKSKKYIVPSAVVSPIFAGCVLAVYVGTGAGHFEPARDALVFDPGNNPQQPMGREDRLAYQRQLKHLLADVDAARSSTNADRAWSKIQAKAKTNFDEQGHPILQLQVDGHPVRVGDSAENILSEAAPPQIMRELLAARLQLELRKSAPAVSEQEVERDWKLLQQTLPVTGFLTARSAHADNFRGNHP